MAVSPAAALGVAAVGLVALAVAAVAWLHARPHLVAAPPPRIPRAVGSTPAGPAPSTSASPAPMVVVDVVGPVRRPGVVRLPAGSRVIDAVAAAGGLRPGASPGVLNLAAPLTDGQQVVVGATVAAPPPAGGSTGGGSTGPGAPVDLNTATVEQLDTLPGVGPVLAQRIVDWRQAHGRFTRVEQLAEVGGIGERRLADLRARVRV
jgi:competence protein ComEA